MHPNLPTVPRSDPGLNHPDPRVLNKNLPDLRRNQVNGRRDLWLRITGVWWEEAEKGFPLNDKEISYPEVTDGRDLCCLLKKKKKSSGPLIR